MSKPVIGVRREDINRWERRAPLTPRDVEHLVRKEGLAVVVQPSDIRVFANDEYVAGGATVTEDLSAAGVIFAVKEIPLPSILPGKPYVFFSHVIKGQAANMPMLKTFLERGCSLVDYEKVTDARGRRLLFFGRFAGLAGMMDSLWALGQRLLGEGLESAFADLRPAHHYDSLDEVYGALSVVSNRIARRGLNPALVPLVVGFTGYGHVSQGAQELLAAVRTEELAPQELDDFFARGRWSDKVIYKVVFHEEHMAAPRDAGGRFGLQDYYDHPEKYRGVFARYLPCFTVVVNGIYWEPRYPRLITKDDLRALYADGQPRLRVIGDISCDIEGSVEVTTKATSPDAPVYVYDVNRDTARDGFVGDGPVILAVYNLPAELPRDASAYFGARLLPYVPVLARADWKAGLENSGLPPEIAAGVIVYDGDLTPAYKYLAAHLPTEVT